MTNIGLQRVATGPSPLLTLAITLHKLEFEVFLLLCFGWEAGLPIGQLSESGSRKVLELAVGKTVQM